MQKYGYEIDQIRFSVFEWLRFIFFEFPLNVARMLAWLLREALLNRVGRALPAERVVSEKEAIKLNAL